MHHKPRNLCLWIIAIIFLNSCGPKIPEELAESYANLPEIIDFNFHVKPILSDRCFSCHGPDANKREAGLRLDIEEVAKGDLLENPGHVAIKPGNISQSHVFLRIMSKDSDAIMPPSESNLYLSEIEKAVLTKWINQGAKWKQHWSFIPPKKQKPPKVKKHKDWIKNPIDPYIFSRLERENLSPSTEANRERLLRRVSMDLTGLPPTLEEIDAFLKDESEDAYEKVIDRLMHTDAYAERLAMEWMDVARYADSHGMHADGWRMMWPWRDWVIQAFKDNMPYDQFVSWQLAGDLYPHASREQRIATAFNRNHATSSEAGAIDEEYRLNYVFDRTETFGTAFLGLTLNCARCHDHKFDPLSQKEYYQLTAYFNNIRELGIAANDGNFGPYLRLSNPIEDQKLDSIKQLIFNWEKKKNVLKTQGAVSHQTTKNLSSLLEGLIDHYPLDRSKKSKKKGFHLDNNVYATSNSEPEHVPGKVGNAIRFDKDYEELYVRNNINFEWPEPFAATIWFNTIKQMEGLSQTILATAGDKNNYRRGWELYLDDQNTLNVRFISAYPGNYFHVQYPKSLNKETWYHVAFSYDGSGSAKGLSLYLDGNQVDTHIHFDRLYKTIKTTAGRDDHPVDRAIRVGKNYRGFDGDNGIFLGMLDDIYLYKRAISSLEVFAIYQKGNPDAMLPKDGKLWVEHGVMHSAKRKGIEDTLQQHRFAFHKIMNPIPELMVMEEMVPPRATFAYNRGAYDAPMYEVSHGLPGVFPTHGDEQPRDRMVLTKWLFDKQNPLTARVAVNRYWQMLFGRGIVNTPQDFGVQGELPSHPELLDWLAVDFMEHNWDLHHLIKQILLSHTYRQSSQVSQELLDKDPENILLARGSTYRLPAEMIRDNALAASGLLVQRVGGPSVKPYQPDSLWIEKGSFSPKLLRYRITRGDSLYRRSMYTFIKRTSPPPAMIAFDLPGRNVCTVQRENTNTPLQALILMNDPQFVEAARVLAERMQIEGGKTLKDQVDYAFRLGTGRKAKTEENALLIELYHKQLGRISENNETILPILTVGDYQGLESLDPKKTAALAIVASTILNHDEAYMRR